VIFTFPVLIYQLLFVVLLFVASRFGRKPLTIAMVVCLLWTATHLFFLPLAILQTGVIVSSYLLFRGATQSGTTKQQ
jgi:hypothetical protein